MRKKMGLKRASLSFRVAATKACTALPSTRPTSCIAAGCCWRQSSARLSSSKMESACSAATADGMPSVAVWSSPNSATAEESPSCKANHISTMDAFWLSPQHLNKLELRA